MQFTCATCSLPVKAGKVTCFYAASTSRREHTTACNKARKSRVTSLAGYRLTYLQLEAEFTRGMIADYLYCGYFCLQLRVFLFAIASIFAGVCRYFCLQLRVFLPAIVKIFASVCRCFCLRLLVFLPEFVSILPANCMYICLQKQAFLHVSRGQICRSSACKIACKELVTYR